MDIIPSVNVATKDALVARVRELEARFERAHLDIADGLFVQSKTIDDLGDLETELIFRVHLMVSKPENHIAKWLALSGVEGLTFHVEATAKHKEVIDLIREGDIEAGIAVNPQTPWKDIEPWVNLVDLVHFMTVEPGPDGSEFVPAVIDKIADFHFYYPDKRIIVDGGITPKNIDALAAAGAMQCVVGSHLYDFKL